MPALPVAGGRRWLGLLAASLWPAGLAGLDEVAVLEQQVRQLLDAGLAGVGEERLRLLRAAVEGAASERGGAPAAGVHVLGTESDEAAFWDLRVRVADWGAFAARLIVSSWQTCRWTRAFPITADSLSGMGLDLPAVKAIRRCDGSTGISYHNCYFYDAATFSRLGIEVPVLGYLVEDANWAEDGAAHNEPCEAPAEGPQVLVPHPGRAAFPRGLGRWLADRLAEKGLLAPGEARPEQLAAAAASAMARLAVCSEDVRGFWGSWSPPAGSQIIMVGCGTMCCDNPTQPLLDAGMGGLFVDARRGEIVRARREFGGPGRAIVNATVSTSSLPGLMEKHSRFVQQVEVVQIDIDNMDGPVLMALLDDFVSPSVIVVEVRHALPFPFAYACVECGMEEVALKGLGGATLGYWLRELGRRGYELRAMDRLDAVFVKLGAPRPRESRREHLLGTLACYLRNSLAVQRPKDLLNPLLAPLGPPDVSPEALERIRDEFSSLHNEFKFVLGL